MEVADGGAVHRRYRLPSDQKTWVNGVARHSDSPNGVLADGRPGVGR